MSASTRILFALGARLHKSASEIERLSVREIVAWVEFFTPEQEGANDDDAIDPRTASRDAMRGAFHG